MPLKNFSRNGQILPLEQAMVPFSSIEYAYGFGVYENVRVTDGYAWFIDDHIDRLLRSATVIDLRHEFDADTLKKWITELIATIDERAINLKILLIGARNPADCTLAILPLAPLFPDRKLYRDGATAITVEHERLFPQAKTLNMFPSFMAYNKARAKGCYDALFVNRQGHITEGTRTNFFAIRGKTLFSSPEAEILPGVTRLHVLKAAEEHGFSLQITDLPLHSIGAYDGAFLTSTSSKIMPLKQIDAMEWKATPKELKELMKVFEEYLETMKKG